MRINRRNQDRRLSGVRVVIVVSVSVGNIVDAQTRIYSVVKVTFSDLPISRHGYMDTSISVPEILDDGTVFPVLAVENIPDEETFWEAKEETEEEEADRETEDASPEVKERMKELERGLEEE